MEHSNWHFVLKSCQPIAGSLLRETYHKHPHRSMILWDGLHKAKILLQDIWWSKLSWDEPLPTDIRDRWISILVELLELPKLTVPRPYFTSSSERYNTCNINIFSDASTKANGVVVYLCQQDQVCVVMFKSKISPTRAVTLPKLELMAAVMASRLANFDKSSLHQQVS